MKLQRMLRDKGISPEEFLSRSKSDDSIAWRGRVCPVNAYEIEGYVFFAFLWSAQPEGHEFWRDVSLEWANASAKKRWIELDAVIGWLDPLEVELLEVKDDAAADAQG